MEFKKELESRVILNNLINVVRVRLLGINDAIRGLRKSKHNKNNVQKELFKNQAIKQLVQFRKTTNIILNKLVLLQKKEDLDISDISSLKNEFMQLDMHSGTNNENNTG